MMDRAFYNSLVLVLVVLIANIGTLFAKETLGLNYPELLVTPRASTRLKIEAINEKHRKWQTHLSVQASGLMTLTAGLLQLGNVNTQKDPDKQSAYAAILVGGGWLGLTAALSKFYTPYATGYKSIARLKKGTAREQLLRERMAESKIEQASRMAKRLTWFSSISNAASSLYLLSNQEEDTISGPVNLLALIAAFSPVIVPYIWERVDLEQKRYKKRIYGPVVMATMLPVGSATKLGGQSTVAAPGIIFSTSF
jgi:hypothetical protein